MAARPSRFVAPSLVRALGILVAAAGCADPPPAERPVVAHEDPGVHLRRIGTVWSGDTIEEGFLDNDPAGIAYRRIRTVVKLSLREGGQASETIEREELFRLQSGEERRCKARGPVPVAARFSSRDGQVRVALETGSAELPRACDRIGMPATSTVPAARVVFVLRSDELVAVEPARARDVLRPIQ